MYRAPRRVIPKFVWIFGQSFVNRMPGRGPPPSADDRETYAQINESAGVIRVTNGETGVRNTRVNLKFP